MIKSPKGSEWLLVETLGLPKYISLCYLDPLGFMGLIINPNPEASSPSACCRKPNRLELQRESSPLT